MFVIKENTIETPENEHNLPETGLLDLTNTQNQAPTIGKSLGMYFTLKEDDSYITFEHLSAIATTLKDTKVLSKRTISAAAGYFFNPLGELALISVSVKVCLSLAWKLDFKGWDTDLSKPLKNPNLPSNESEIIRQKIIKYYNIFIKNLEICSKWKIPRYIFGKNCVHNLICKKDIILSTDSGKYSKCINLYLRALLQNGKIISGLICSKTRLNTKRTKNRPKIFVCLNSSSMP